MARITKLVPRELFDEVRRSAAPEHRKLQLLADLARLNTLSMVKRAGSGHLGTSLSAMDIVTFLTNSWMNTYKVGHTSPDRDIYFSSKGHDVPGLYAVLFSHGVVPRERLLKLRRLGGLDGHPDVGVPGIEANSGSLGMGISKARGMAWAKRFLGRKGRVVVMLGDGELQEGQNFEALQSTVHQGVTNLFVVVDHNKVQSDKLVSEILSLGDLPAKFRAFGWHVERCDGHDYAALAEAFRRMESVTDKPKVLIADTVKGRGISFMEHPQALRENNGFYRWHSGAPDDETFERAFGELEGRLAKELAPLGLKLDFETFRPDSTDLVSKEELEGEPDSRGAAISLKGSGDTEYVVQAYGLALAKQGRARKDLVVLDADLSADCRLRAFESEIPERFIENGIAEQDMVSMAGGLARQGLLPVVNSFANFLAARANEQIYNNASEKTKIVYACHYAGLIPAGPGKSHQSLRDISLFSAFADALIVQPANTEETEYLLDYLLGTHPKMSMMRLPIGPSPKRVPFKGNPKLGCGVVLREGGPVAMVSYGPVMLHETLLAAELLEQEGVRAKVINMPWLNRFEEAWWKKELAGLGALFVVEDHSVRGGLGDQLASFLAEREMLKNLRFQIFGVEGHPACGTPAEALAFHGLDGKSLARRVRELGKH